jgi:transposase
VLAQGSLSGDRNLIERFFGRLKINGAIATRYDQLAAARYWLKFAHAA